MVYTKKNWKQGLEQVLAALFTRDKMWKQVSVHWQWVEEQVQSIHTMEYIQP